MFYIAIVWIISCAIMIIVYPQLLIDQQISMVKDDDIGLKTNISKLGICSSDDIDLISNNVNIERLNNNAVVISEETLKKYSKIPILNSLL